MSTKFPYKPDYAFPPGDTLLETLESIGLTQKELADLSGCGPDFLYDLERGKPTVVDAGQASADHRDQPAAEERHEVEAVQAEEGDGQERDE